MAGQGIGRHNAAASLVTAEMTPKQRDRLVRWWIEASGLTPTELRETLLACGQIASSITSSR